MNTFSAMRVLNHLGCAALVVGSMVGCAEVQDLQQKLNSALATTPARPAPAIQDTPLYNMFSGHPKEQGGYPRVAIRILSAPPDHTVTVLPKMNPNDSTTAHGCWVLSATIWKSETQSTPVPQFSWCYELDGAGVSTEQAARWLRGFNVVYLQNERLGKTTGSVMTDGPTPPDHRYPNDPHSEAWFGGDPTEYTTMDYWMLTGVLYDTGLNWGDSTEYRFWYVSVPAK